MGKSKIGKGVKHIRGESEKSNKVARKSKNIEKGKKTRFVIFWGIISEKGKRCLCIQ